MRTAQKIALAPLSLLTVFVLAFLLSSKGLHAVSATSERYEHCDTAAPQALPKKLIQNTVPRPTELPFPLNRLQLRDSTGRLVDLYGRPVGC